MKNFTKILTIGSVAGIALATLVGVMPAQAATVTSFTASPTTVRSGETISFTVNGSTTPNSASDTFTGCYVYFIDGTPITNPVNGAISLPGQSAYEWDNFSGVDSTLRFAGWAGENCSPLPTGTPTFDTGIITVTPQVVIDPVTLEVGKPITTASFPYSYKAAGGTYPFDWTTGGQFTETDADSCNNIAVPAFTTALPDGVTIDDTLSANGESPNLVLSGTPKTVGTYDVCLRLEGDSDGVAFAWMTIMVEEPKLPATGLDSAVIATAAGGAGIVAAAGLFLVAMRRRRSS